MHLLLISLYLPTKRTFGNTALLILWRNIIPIPIRFTFTIKYETFYFATSSPPPSATPVYNTVQFVSIVQFNLLNFIGEFVDTERTMIEKYSITFPTRARSAGVSAY